MANVLGTAWKLKEMAREYERRAPERSADFRAYYRGLVEGLRLAAATVQSGVAEKREKREKRHVA